jgi:glycosyltransferase involved in cell wall biosynthesis
VNVLHLIVGRGPTGPAAASMSDVKALRAAGHTAYIASRHGTGLMDACNAEDVPYVGGLKLGRGAMRILHFPHDIRKLRAIVREFSIDVIHVHRSDDQLLAAAAIGKTLTTTLVRTWHRHPRTVPRPLLSRLAAQADGCVCVSREHAEALTSAGAKTVEFIHVGVDTKTFQPLTEKPLGPVRIGHVGRWKQERDGRDRGQRAALDVFAALKSNRPWNGLLVGRGEMADALCIAAYDERKLSRERVELVHFEKQTPAGFAAMLGSLDLGLVFSTGSDGTSRAAAELLACGVPLIVADVPGLRELAEDSASALRQLPDDANGWARAIEKILADPAKLAAMQAAARKRAESAHALAARGKALADFYSSL